MSDDPINHPAHYTSHPAGIEAITIVEHFTFNVGNAVKYALASRVEGRRGQASGGPS
jgi:hypothetical protein